jgi:hypothetical protein
MEDKAETEAVVADRLLPEKFSKAPMNDHGLASALYLSRQ